ncbi:MAG: PAS domain-containing protein [Ignavibacteria bacterium]|nr:PAS domain-containing protein [Ignavibacteria bacterium]
MKTERFKIISEGYFTQFLVVISLLILFFSFFLFTDYGSKVIDLIFSYNWSISLVIALSISFFVLLIAYILNIRIFINKKNAFLRHNANAHKFRSEILRALDIHSDLFCFVNNKLQISWANQALLSLDSAIVGKSIMSVFFHEEETYGQPTIVQSSLKSMKIKTIVKYYPPNSLYKDEKYFKHACIPIFDVKSEIVFLFFISKDVTARIQFEDAKHHLTSVIDASEDAIFVVDKQGILHSWNKEAERMFGYSAEQMVGQPITILDHYVDFEILVSIFSEENIQQKKGIRHIEMVQINRLDRQYFVSFTIYPFFNEAGDTLGISTIVRDRTEAVMAERALIESEQQMRNLALHLDKVIEDERKEIASAIHDELGYSLSAIKRDIIWLQREVNKHDSKNKERVEDMVKLVDTTIQKVKSISLNLRPAVLDHFGLVAAIEWQAGEFQRRMATRCKVVIEPNDIVVEEEFKVPIFRIFQEALTNITRHAKASRVDVSLTQKDNILELRVTDNGIGIPPEKINDPNCFGLLGIREKAASIGGVATIERREEGGTCVFLKLEMKQNLKQ